MKLKKFKPTDYVKVIKNGKVIKEGLGLSVFYNNLTTNIMVAPSTAFDGAFAFDDVVTSDYHVPRALALAEDYGLSATGIGSPCLSEYWIKNHSRETLAWVKYWLKKYLHLNL